MRPLSALSAETARGLHGLLFDLDDTLLVEGRLTEAAYAALFRLRESGLRLVIVTGRPSGWGDVLVRQWPVEAAVTENGAVLVDRRSGHCTVRDCVDEAERRRRRGSLAVLVSELMDRFPELRATGDVGQRLSDFAFDIGERQRVPAEVIERAREFARSRGARVICSSIHLHVTWDRDDKATGTVRLLGELLGVDATAARFRFAFVGDSANDASCFAGFDTTFGVRNLSGLMTVPPRYRTERPAADGFVELSQKLVALRNQGPLPS